MKLPFCCLEELQRIKTSLIWPALSQIKKPVPGFCLPLIAVLFSKLFYGGRYDWYKFFSYTLANHLAVLFLVYSIFVLGYRHWVIPARTKRKEKSNPFLANIVINNGKDNVVVNIDAIIQENDTGEVLRLASILISLPYPAFSPLFCIHSFVACKSPNAKNYDYHILYMSVKPSIGAVVMCIL
jgi:hypothetical protein